MITFAKKFKVHPSTWANPPYDQQEKEAIASILENEEKQKIAFPASLEVEVEFAILASRLQQKERNDIDNLVKLFFECLTEWGGVWEDDCQVNKLLATRIAVQNQSDQYIAVIIRTPVMM